MSSTQLKIIFAGLDQAGKTSIYQKTIAGIDPSQLKNLRPTRGVERHSTDFIDIESNIWDLGGQESYREKYLKNPQTFNETKALIFVLDVQDTKRYQEAYDYFLSIVKIIQNIKPQPRAYIFFHKCDPEIVKKIRADFFAATRLFRQADTFLENKFVGFATSIFSETVDQAMQRVFWECFPGIDLKPQSSLEIIDDRGALITDTTTEEEVVADEAPKIEDKIAEDEVASEIVERMGSLQSQIMDRLSQAVEKRMNKTDDIIALAVLSTKGDILFGVSKGTAPENAIPTVSDIIKNVDADEFFGGLGELEIEGPGHVPLEEFDLHFAELSEEQAIVIFCKDGNDSATLEEANGVVKLMRQALAVVPRSAKSLSRSELADDLKSRISKIRGT
jgi:hypothetical protein